MKMLLRVVPLLLIMIGIKIASMGSISAQDQLVFSMISHGDATSDFWMIVIKGMEEACELLDADCEWHSSSSDNLEDMTALWEEALARNPDGIGTTAPNPEIIRDGVAQATEAGIPVIVFNTADPNEGTPDALPTLFYIGANEFLGGRSNALAVLEAANASGVQITRGVCLIHEAGHSGLEARCAGVQSVFGESGIPLENLIINNDIEESAAALETFLNANADVNAVFLLGTNPASSLHRYVQDKGIAPGELFATTHDTNPEVYDMIREGYLIQAIDQQPYLQGFESIMWLYLNSQFALVPGGNILTGPGVIDGSNVDEIAVLTEQGYR